MSVESAPGRGSKIMFWCGWALTLLLGAGLTFSGVMKFMQPPEMAQEFQKLGWSIDLAFALGVIEIVCVVLYRFPWTAGLGAILLTGYLGGAVATHVRVGDAFVGPVIGGVLVWVALFLRDARVRALFPIRW